MKGLLEVTGQHATDIIAHLLSFDSRAYQGSQGAKFGLGGPVICFEDPLRLFHKAPACQLLM